MTLGEYQDRMGGILSEAVAKGGEALLDRVEAEMGVASRHLARIRYGLLSLTPAVASEIEKSFDRAEATLRKGVT